ncbi:MAG: hypothetical protein KF861_05965, partial [Planctomycetaceae bacterium]|nr:hypothetical protein [Planctomycetaceae bacterium]
ISTMSPGLVPHPWGSAAAVSPDLALSLLSPQSVHLILTPVRPTREAAVRESLAVQGSLLQWHADVEMECTAAPVALHRFQVDPRIRLTSVSVSQNGVDRLVRWSRASDQDVVLWLTGELLGRQSIRLTGEIPLLTDTPLDVPRLVIPETRLTQHEFVFRASPGWRVQILNGEGGTISNALEGASNEPLTVNGAAEDARTFDRLNKTRPLTFTVSAESTAPMSYERVLALQVEEGKRLHARTVIRFPEQGTHVPRVTIVVPAEWSQIEPFTATPQPASISERPDGSVELIYDGLPSRSSNRTVEMTAHLIVPGNGPWIVPNVSLTDGEAIRDNLIVSEEFPFEIAGHSPLRSLDQSVPDLAAPVVETISNPRRVYLSSGLPWTLVRSSTNGAPTHVVRIESAVWDSASDEFTGVTFADVSLNRAEEVRVDLPDGLRVLRVAWNGVLLPSPADGDSQLVIPSSASNRQRQSHELKLWWQSRRSWFAFRSSIPLPRVAGVPVVHESALFLGRMGTDYRSGGSWQPHLDLSMAGRPAATDQPISAALSASGYSLRRMAALLDEEPSRTILLGEIPARVATGPYSTVTVWAFNQRLTRALWLALALALAACIAQSRAWRSRVQSLWASHTTQIFAGPTVLAAMLWAMGPSVIGFWLLILMGTAWIVAIRWPEFVPPAPRQFADQTS